MELNFLAKLGANVTLTSSNFSIFKMVENNENGMVSLNVVQEMMKVQKEAILSCFNMIVENLSKKVDNIMCDLQDLKSGVNHMGEKNHEKFVEVDRKLDIVKHEIKSSKEYYLNDHEAIKHHSEKIIDLEDRSRRNNLRIDGIKECAGESAEQTEEKVRLMLRQNLNIETKIEIDRAHRVGKPKKQQTKNNCYAM